MSELTDEIVNKGLAEFMGLNIDYLKDLINVNKTMIKPQKEVPDKLYTESLDALVPVWEKLKECSYPKFHKNEKGFSVSMSVEYFKGYNRVEFVEVYEMKTIQQAAAYATYKAVKELSTKENRLND
jgi:hypothetical protein